MRMAIATPPRVRPIVAAIAAACLGVAARADDARPAALTLDQRLQAEGPSALARAAREEGDARRGAAVFYRQDLACSGCHAIGGEGPALGPDLATLGKGVSDVELIEAILLPSKSIKKGFETVTIAKVSGETVTGLLVEDRPDALVVRDPSRGDAPIRVARAEIDAQKVGGPSIMPPALADQVGSRPQFLDLIRYLREIADAGPTRARELRPAPTAPTPLPAYEREIDHAGLIAGLGPESLQRGEAIYGRVCANCHGTKDRPGSLPTSLRFASGAFKNGGDPFSMYRTLTHGYGQMAPQTWMVPTQKYDVIHYIREAYLKADNPAQYARVDRDYLARLPKGSTRGPEPSAVEPWSVMDYGPYLLGTFEVGKDGSNIAYKGMAIRLDPGPGGVARGRRWVVYEHDTMRMAAAWEGAGFIDWNGINFNGRHEIHPRIVGRVLFATPSGPGWARPGTESFDDPRPKGRDDRRYGPLPRDWSRFRGFYRQGDRAILAYNVGQAEILDSPGIEANPAHPDRAIVSRTLDIGRSPQDLLMKVAKAGAAVAIVDEGQARLLDRDGYTLLRIPSAATPTVVKLLISDGDREALRALASNLPAPGPLGPSTHGGPSRWPEVLGTKATIGRDDGPFAVDTFGVPEANPWSCQMRLSGLDFLPDGRGAAVCSWDGDVWIVGGLDDPAGGLRWRRIASGLFQPLGLKVVGGQIYVACRDQIVRLRDLDGDGETDFYEAFNSDHQVTEHFHEFAMDLQADAEGNFYYAKAARHGKTALVPQHGTLLRVTKDGARTDILAGGFRAPNGVCLNPDGTFFLTDQEGFWMPKNRINWVRPGRLYGNMWAYHDVTDAADEAMEPPVCWITNAFDRSPAEVVRVESKSWGPLDGTLLSLSYGYGKFLVFPHEQVGDQMQGGLCALPIAAFPTGVMRGRFRPVDGHLYACGMFAWAGNQTQPGGFYRIRATGKPAYLPTGLSARKSGMEITFSAPIDRRVAADPARYAIKTWSLKRSAEYGSKHLDERSLQVVGATLSGDGHTVRLAIPEIRPTRGMEIHYSLKGAGGEAVDGTIHNTIHRLRD